MDPRPDRIDQVRLYNRRTRAIETERVPAGRLLGCLYSRTWGRRACDAVWSRIWFSRLYGWPFHRNFSRRQIEGFIRQNSIDMAEVALPEGGFASFNDFFTRRLKPGARPVDEAPSAVISPADSRLKVFPIKNGSVLKIKGADLTLSQLLGSTAAPEGFDDGLCLQFRLAPCDYHRFGYIADGIQGPIHEVMGRLYSVSPLALGHMPDIWWRNLRHWCFVQSLALGTILQIEVGATVVGSIVQQRPTGGACRRGQEKGYFQMGGSTVLIVVQSGKVAVDSDILHHSEKGIETLVKYGETIGRSPH
jgi:phosphatidylserine decarboxylase